MPDEPRRIILEKSKTVKRRYQRSNQRFQFTASQIARLDREEEREKKAKKLREKEKKRIANKKRKAEQEAQAREERKRRGIPDPNAARVPSSQPLLSMFLGAGKRQSPAAPEPAPTVTELESHENNLESASGDTEAESDAFDDLDEVLEKDLSELQDSGVRKELQGQEIGTAARAPCKDDDEFSDCSAFDDEEIMKKAETAATTRTTDEETKKSSIPRESSFLQSPPAVLALESSFGGSFQYDPADFLEAEAAIITQMSPPGTKDRSPPKDSSLLQPPLSDRPYSRPTLASSFGDSFRDETADWIEETFAHGNGDPFDELHKTLSQ
ncbi:hypothetical protein N7489_006232 [Penicillium chrysogenum]|jgi:hypothetical protein|uniref:Uncharacterized protein n=1 Tax=Penicillium chrysogenum TaxID=5076 RepID=A0ABQ8W2X9_PENCH|nr:uncharacterized protein N7489_006232 [Penicillium chrysogenum]KAJ5236141.1 hypothetical protein N7489_006232 [Penicillium chrysogenum]KAJ5255047.1 hypothetical protein N7505_010198 [Penicillium chrysogenum]KAJ5276081.1 hypothetical protein N7524_002234 [Penicillium chrysogenum]KAJ6153158.1 hypothetical protein N7497_007477 [Penicillium chrysogenum]